MRYQVLMWLADCYAFFIFWLLKVTHIADFPGKTLYTFLKSVCVSGRD